MTAAASLPPIPLRRQETSSHQEIKAVAELLGDDYKVVVKACLHTNETGKHNLVDMLNE